MSWWNRNKELKTEVGRLEHQIKLMQDHIQAQKEEILSSKKQIRELEMLLDISNNIKRY